MDSLKQINFYFLISCIIGLLLSCYALFVELQTEKNKHYEAYCDINEYISCTKAFSSKYGKGFGIIGSVFGDDSMLNQPNSVGGIIFYFLLAVMNFSKDQIMVKIQLFLCVLSNFMSIYLAFILYFILKDLCVVCASTYVLNAVMLALSFAKSRFIKQKLSEKGSKLKKK